MIIRHRSGHQAPGVVEEMMSGSQTEEGRKLKTGRENNNIIKELHINGGSQVQDPGQSWTLTYLGLFVYFDDDCLTSCLKMNPEMPATSSARNIKVKNMAYCGKNNTHTHTRTSVEGSRQSESEHGGGGGTDQFEHPRAAAARGEASEQAEDDDGGPRPDEDVRRVGAFLRRQREIGLQADLPPHAHGQQDHACELEVAGR